jgi:hypothetical protein
MSPFAPLALVLATIPAIVLVRGGARTAEIYRRNRSFFAALPQMGDSDF